MFMCTWVHELRIVLLVILYKLSILLTFQTNDEMKPNIVSNKHFIKKCNASFIVHRSDCPIMQKKKKKNGNKNSKTIWLLKGNVIQRSTPSPPSFFLPLNFKSKPVNAKRDINPIIANLSQQAMLYKFFTPFQLPCAPTCITIIPCTVTGDVFTPYRLRYAHKAPHKVTSL